MKLQQLSLFLENAPGQLRLPIDALAKAGINIVTLALADTEQFGILRLIVEDLPNAKTVLEKAGCVVKVTEVLAIEVADQPGGLAHILDVVGKAKLNIEYMYAFTEKCSDTGLLVFRFTDPDAALAAFKAAKINVRGNGEIFGRA